MANSRRYIHTYKGIDITKINNYKYCCYDKNSGKSLTAYTLKEMHRLIDGVVGYVS